MKTNKICFNCGAEIGLHQSITFKCPKNGIEETRFDKLTGKYLPQNWENTVFEDAEIKKVKNMAPELLKNLNESNNILKIIIEFDLLSPDQHLIIQNQIKINDSMIKKATE